MYGHVGAWRESACEVPWCVFLLVGNMHWVDWLIFCFLQHLIRDVYKTLDQ